MVQSWVWDSPNFHQLRPSNEQLFKCAEFRLQNYMLLQDFKMASVFEHRFYKCSRNGLGETYVSTCWLGITIPTKMLAHWVTRELVKHYIMLAYAIRCTYTWDLDAPLLLYTPGSCLSLPRVFTSPAQSVSGIAHSLKVTVAEPIETIGHHEHLEVQHSLGKSGRKDREESYFPLWQNTKLLSSCIAH